MRVSPTSSAMYGIAADAVRQARRPAAAPVHITLQHVPDNRQGDRSSWTHGLVGRALHETLVSGFMLELDRHMEERGDYPELAPYPDPTVEGTAARIASSTPRLYEIWKRQNPEGSESEILDRFETVIRGAVNLGYKQATSVIEGLNMGARDSRDADRIVGLVHLELDRFFSARRADLENGRDSSQHPPGASPSQTNATTPRAV